MLISSYSDNRARGGIEAIPTLSAAVDMEGTVRDVVVQVPQGTDGKYYCNLSRDMGDGARFMVPEDAGTSEGMAANSQRPLPAMEGNPVDLNLEFAPASRKGDAAITDEDMRGIARDLNAMPEIVAMGGRVPRQSIVGSVQPCPIAKSASIF